MQRLVVFGCSLTFGHGLADCYEPPHGPGAVPSKLGWPSILAKYMGRECVNMSSPGASNKRIWNEVTKFKFKADDVVVIHWSFIDRTSIIKSTGIDDIGPWTEHSFYKDIYNEYDSLLMSKLFVNHANMFLNAQGITLYNIVPSRNELPMLEFNGVITDHVPVHMSHIRALYPLALDKRHPGIECQEVFSKWIMRHLGIDNDLVDHKPFSFFGQLQRYMEFRRNN